MEIYESSLAQTKVPIKAIETPLLELSAKAPFAEKGGLMKAGPGRYTRTRLINTSVARGVGEDGGEEAAGRLNERGSRPQH